MLRQRASRRLGIVLAAGMLAMGAAACTNPAAGSSANDGSHAGKPTAGFPVSVKGKLGTAHVTSRPIRVVAMDWTDADIALSLGVTPVGMASVSTASGGIEPWTKKLLGHAKPKLFDTDSGDPVDQIAALSPDLILATKDYNLGQSYGQLSKIAPVVTYANAPDSDSWQTDTQNIARALGKTAQANTSIARATAAIKSARSANPALAGKTYNFLVTPQTSGVHAVNTTSDASARFLDQLGLTLAPEVQKMKTSSIPGRAQVSWENIGQLNADVLLATGPPSSLGLIKTIPGFTSLPAVKKGAYVPLDSALAQAIAFPSAPSLTWAISQLMPKLTAAAKKLRGADDMNPFDDPDGEFLVLVNDEGQHSLWPSFTDVPAGWTVARDRDTREACLAYVEDNWTDMRPASLAAAMDGGITPSAIKTNLL